MKFGHVNLHIYVVLGIVFVHLFKTFSNCETVPAGVVSFKPTVFVSVVQNLKNLDS